MFSAFDIYAKAFGDLCIRLYYCLSDIVIKIMAMNIIKYKQHSGLKKIIFINQDDRIFFPKFIPHNIYIYIFKNMKTTY